MKRTGVRRRRGAAMLLLAVAVSGVLTWAGGPAGAGQAQDRAPARTYTVRPGDTLWRIAGRVSDGRADVRAVVDAIAAANDVDPGAMPPGLVLEIPADLG